MHKFGRFNDVGGGFECSLLWFGIWDLNIEISVFLVGLVSDWSIDCEFFKLDEVEFFGDHFLFF